MDALLQTYREQFYFVYGLVFAAMGLATALYARRSSRLELARSLKWLAAFGLLHGFYEWSDLWLPNPPGPAPSPQLFGADALQLVLLAGSFACLLQFGVSLVRPLSRWKWIVWAAPVLLAAWFLVVFLILPLGDLDHIEWRRLGNALARYSMCFPGAMLSAFGLRRQALARLQHLQTPQIHRMLRLAGVALALYAVFGGLVTPPIAFFPGSFLNTETFQVTLGIPVIFFRSAIGVILAVSVIRALEVFDLEVERIIEGMEQQQILIAERERIGRELHDGMIQKVYTAGLLVESAAKTCGPGGQTAERLGSALSLIRDVIDDLRQNMVELRERPPGESLTARLEKLAADPNLRNLVQIRLELNFECCEPASPARVNHILSIVNEALANVARHAQANHVIIRARVVDEACEVCIEDDGVGIAEEAHMGFGLRNMRDRARLLGGRLDLLPRSPHGSIVRLTIPTSEEG